MNAMFSLINDFIACNRIMGPLFYMLFAHTSCKRAGSDLGPQELKPIRRT